MIVNRNVSRSTISSERLTVPAVARHPWERASACKQMWS